MLSFSHSTDFSIELKTRRLNFAKKLNHPCIVVIDAAPEQYICNDNEYRYRQDSDFYYLCGFPESNSCLVMLIHNDYDFLDQDPIINYRLYVQPRDKNQEIWSGPRIGPHGAVQKYGADSGHSIIDKAEQDLTQLFIDYKDQNIYFSSRDSNSIASKVINKLCDSFKHKIRNALIPLHDLRVIKTSFEIELLRYSCEISSQAHNNLLNISGWNEYIYDGAFTGYVMSKGCKRLAYPNIIGSGTNSTILHYQKNHDIIQNGDLVLVDAGGEYRGYASDITRTWPSNGKFSETQQNIYELVLRVNKECIEKIRPGIEFNVLEDHAIKILGQGLFDLGIITNKNLSTIRQFYMHSLGHWLGMDVHDCFTLDIHETTLKAGMVFTIEPGLYFSPYLDVDCYTNKQIFERYCGIGIRIEDDILVTENGHEVLSSNAVKELREIESLRNI